MIHINKYTVILADCPWRYDYSPLEGAAENQYRTMHINEICALPVADIAADDCVLFLWATFPKLPEALRVIKEWGFQYKTVAFVWLKNHKNAKGFRLGLGFWTRGNAEICLLATRGRPKRQNACISQLIISPLEKHSKKPDIVREKIVELMGDVPRIELFARQRAFGWDAMGNEIDGLDIRDALHNWIGGNMAA